MGDLVRLQTFSFDRYLDRNVRNECGNRVQPNPAHANLDWGCALSKAAGHEYYDNESGFWVNHAYRPDGSNPFNTFINALHNGHNAANAAARGANFVENYLWNPHGIVLTGGMKTHLQNYLFAVLNGGGWAYGRNWAAGSRSRHSASSPR